MKGLMKLIMVSIRIRAGRWLLRWWDDQKKLKQNIELSAPPYDGYSNNVAYFGTIILYI